MKKFMFVIALSLLASPVVHANFKKEVAKVGAKLVGTKVITNQDIIQQLGKAHKLAVSTKDDGAKIFLVEKDPVSGLVVTANSQLKPIVIFNKTAADYRSLVEINLQDVSRINALKIQDLVNKNKSWLETGRSTAKYNERTDVKMLYSGSSDAPAAIVVEALEDNPEYLRKLALLINEAQKISKTSTTKTVAAVKIRASGSR